MYPITSAKEKPGNEKRSFERFAAEGTHYATSEEKRQKVPALTSVIVEAVRMDSLQKLCSSLEPILRRVVGEEVERALAKLFPTKLGLRDAFSRQIEDCNGSNLRLQFRTRLALPLFTGAKIEGDQGLPIHVVLEDASTGQVVTSGPEASAKLDVVVLDGDFNNDEDEGWTAEEFENHVVKERDGKRPLLTGDLTIILRRGMGTLGDLTFTDNSSWIRCRKFRLGIRVAAGTCDGIRIQECKTEAFTVKDHRGELYKKHYPPSLSDEVWRLDKIGKDGAFHKRLEQSGIRTVEDFLRSYVMDPQKLRNILGSGMSNKMWEATVEHAKTCVLSGKLYVFYVDRSQNFGVIFNHIYELTGLITSGHYKSVESLTESEKVYVEKLVKSAYENWNNVIEYESDALVSDGACKSGVVYSQEEGQRSRGSLGGQKEQHSSIYNQQVALQSESKLISSSSSIYTNPTAVNEQLNSEGEALLGYSIQNHSIRNNQACRVGSDLPDQFLTLQGFPSRNGMLDAGRALVHSQTIIPKLFGYPPHQPPQSRFVEWVRTPPTPAVQLEHYFTEEDIRAKSLELLGTEDFQQTVSMHYAENLQFHGDEAYTFSGFSPSLGRSVLEDGTRTSGGKAYVSWLKLKAALRWGIFIRKIAAEKAVKRAQIVELED